MTIPHCLLAVFSAALAALTAQEKPQHDPQPVAVRVRTVLRGDDAPMPGVPVYVVQGRDLQGATLVDGWSRAVDPRVRKLAFARVVRSDPDGFVTLTLPDGKLEDREVFAGAPFRSQRLENGADHLLLRVDRLEQFVVRAIDTAGQALPHFPLALHANGRDEFVAVTDARGMSAFGVDPTFTARLTVLPSGWLGPIDGFPTVAQQLPGKFSTLTVPPFGIVRVRMLRDGKPAPTTVNGANVHAPRACSLEVRGSPIESRGVEFGPVALGQVLRGRVRSGDVSTPFEAAAPRSAGEIVFVEIETNPACPKLTFQVTAVGADLQQCQLLMLVHTDAGAFSASPSIDSDGHVLCSLSGPLRGERLLRVDVDVTQNPPLQPARGWSVSVVVDRPLTADHSLGVIGLAPHEPVLRGRVVDAKGQPVPNANVDIEAERDSGCIRQQRLWSQADGSFEFVGPVFRGEHGAPVRTIAAASLGNGRDAVRGEPSAPLALGSEVTLSLPEPSKGFLELTLHDMKAVPHFMLPFAFVDATGQRRALDLQRCEWTGPPGDVCRLGPLPAGRGSLLVLLRSGVELRRIDGIEVPVGEGRQDPRLTGLDLSDVVRACRMRVIDDQGVPIAGARVEYRGLSDSFSMGPSDAGGWLDIAAVKQNGPRLTISAPGKEPVELTEVQNGDDIRLGPRRRVQVTVLGLPADLPRDRLGVMFRSVVRENLQSGQFVPLGANDAATVPAPPNGRYHLRLCVSNPSTDGGSSWSTAGQRDADVLFGEGAAARIDPAPVEYTLDAETIANLRKMLAK
ncbi:MAG: hypothetical protein ABIP94_19495 [Planctomycetota bacterium]